MTHNQFNQVYIYQLNTRIFCIANSCRVAQLPDSLLLSPEVQAADYLWLMGVWMPSIASVDICKKHAGLREEFKKALPDLKQFDIIGSPYSICEYSPNPLVASHMMEIRLLKKRLNAMGKKLILDFVPNHMSVDSPLIDKYPDLFLSKDGENAGVCKNSFRHKNGRIYYYGRDPYFDGWTDTVQWDFSKEGVLDVHKAILLELAEVCDGVRCDMAMLPLPDIFEKTHGKAGLPYWEPLIKTVREKNPSFIFAAEVYWNREYDLQTLGFNYTYDKELYDRMKISDGKKIKQHLDADLSYQNKSLRFLENHDEARAVSSFGFTSIFYFSLLSFLPGAVLYHEGQSEGRKIKVPVQLARRTDEELDSEIHGFYDRAFATIFVRKGKRYVFEKFDIKPYGEYDLTNMLAYSLHTDTNNSKEVEILIFNGYSEEMSGAMILPENILGILNSFHKDVFRIYDIVTGKTYERSKAEVFSGLFIKLDPFRSHWFKISV